MEKQNGLLPVLAQDGELAVVSVEGQPVVTASGLAKVLGYKMENAVAKIYNRNEESFTEQDTFEINLKQFIPNLGTNSQGGDPHVRVFTKRGALKICMKSNQPRAIQVQEMLLDLYEAVESRRLVPVEALQEVMRRLDELALEVKRMADVQQSKIIYLPKASKPRATDLEAANFLRELFDDNPSLTKVKAIRNLEKESVKQGWRIGSRASLYRLVEKLRK